ncbi:DNA-directed RNA polymerase subunit K [Candidatus Bathyarchaeota archaeon]|nr:DNA-directed RNA polymerase subunit K [Candidatus Bathyarchaeota archaeon]
MAWAVCLRECRSLKETSSNNKIVVGPPKLTRFEKARVVGARALQIAMGAPILIEPSTLSSPIDFALKELESGILPMTIRRTLPDGTFQDVPLKWLLQEE